MNRTLRVAHIVFTISPLATTHNYHHCRQNKSKKDTHPSHTSMGAFLPSVFICLHLQLKESTDLLGLRTSGTLGAASISAPHQNCSFPLEANDLMGETPSAAPRVPWMFTSPPFLPFSLHPSLALSLPHSLAGERGNGALVRAEKITGPLLARLWLLSRNVACRLKGTNEIPSLPARI